MYQAERSEESNLAEDMAGRALGPGGPRLAALACAGDAPPGAAAGRAGLRLTARLQGRARVFLAAAGPQHPPGRRPAPGPPHGPSRLRARAQPSAARAARGASGQSWPGARRPRVPAAPHRAPRPRQAPEPPGAPRRRGRRAQPRSREPQQQNGGRGRSGRPPPPAPQRSATAHARAPAPGGRWGRLVTSRGAANRESGRAPLVRAPALPPGPARGRCGEAVLLEPALGTKRGVQARSGPRARLRPDRSRAGQVKGVAEPTVAGAQMVSGEAPGSFRSPAALAPQDPTPLGGVPTPEPPAPGRTPIRTGPSV
ncbi:proline-rich protein HaeIII subfamily 1-like [Bubalus kerabau]|uniref:proline-rich protein HaeIII subfamily 1-like n=1 Tax=Bubalus carabanensis TaxID=3119969 RepID=UPI00244E7C2C|nr:proline-rich protein HaeIII subfamily 1-like [Bubalus carabanensis]